jgi:hypothetical protein
MADRSPKSAPCTHGEAAAPVPRRPWRGLVPGGPRMACARNPGSTAAAAALPRRGWRTGLPALVLLLALGGPGAACAGDPGSTVAAAPALPAPEAPAREAPARPVYGGDRAVALDGPEARAARAITAAADGARVSAPALDPGLTEAARLLARKASGPSAATAAAGLERAIGPEEVRLALARGGATVPSPVVVAAVADRLDAAIDRLASRARETVASTRVAAAERPDRFGVGVVRQGETVAAVLLLGRRRAAIEPFPARVEVGAAPVLAGKVLPPLGAAEVHVTPPNGQPRRLGPGASGRHGRGVSGGGPGFRVPVSFDRPGRWAVEVLGQGPRGPEVALLLEVWAGRPIPAAATVAVGPATEPDDLGGKAGLVLREVNELRESRGLPPLRLEPRLFAAAKGYAGELARTGRFAHRSEISGDPADRARAAGYRYSRIAENLAQAPTARAAHRATVESPGHLANLLDPSFTEAGFAFARGKNPDGSPTLILVEMFGRRAD